MSLQKPYVVRHSFVFATGSQESSGGAQIDVDKKERCASRPVRSWILGFATGSKVGLPSLRLELPPWQIEDST